MKTSLDKYDLEIIHTLKRANPPSLDNLYNWWSNRCELDMEYVHMEYLVDHLFSIAQIICPRKLDSIVHDSLPSQTWKYHSLLDGITVELADKLIKEKAHNEADYAHNLSFARVLVSHIRLTMVKDIPGFDDYIKQQENSIVKLP